MNKTKQKKRIIILFTLLIIFPTAFFFNSMVANIPDENEISSRDKNLQVIKDTDDTPQLEGPDIPNATHIEPRNEWTWHDDVDVGEKLIFEMDVTMRNFTTAVMAMREFSIVNITSFENITTDFMGPGQILSSVNGSLLFFNYTTKQLETNPDVPPFQLAMFGYNRTHLFFPEKYAAMEGFYQPILLPVNGSKFANVDVNVMDDIINNTYIQMMSLGGFMSHFDLCGSDPGENKIWFKNSTDGYYWDWYFYNNGTLKYAEGYFLVQGESGSLDTIVNITMRRVFSINITDEIEWDFDVGDTFYFGYTGEEGDLELKLDIAAMKREQFTDPMFEFFSGGFMPFYRIYVNISIWNFTSEKWDPQQTNFLIYQANNLYPYFPFYQGGPLPLFFIPKNTKLSDWKFMLNNITAPMVEMTKVYFTENNGELRVRLEDGDEISEIVIIADNATGIVKFYKIQGPEGKIISFYKNTTTVLEPNNLTDFLCYSSLVTNWQLRANVTTNVTYGEDYRLFWALLPENPLNFRFKEELPASVRFFFDVYTNNTKAVESANLTIYYDGAALTAAGVNEAKLRPYAFNFETMKWEVAPSEFYEIDTVNNVIYIYFPAEGGPNSNYFAIGVPIPPGAALPGAGDDDDDDDEGEIIPGYDISILIAIIALFSVIITLNRRKKI